MYKNWLKYIFTAYIFSLFFRLLLFVVAYNNPDFLFNNHIIALWTADAGLYGHYAKDLLHGVYHPLNNETFLSYVIFWIVKYTHIDLESVIFFLPAFFASLIVIPIFLIFAFIKLEKLGFWSAIISSIAMNYYFRTHLGYTDTDILNFFLFFMIIASFIGTVETKKIFWSIPGALSMLFFLYWYHSARPLVFALLGFYVLYLLLFDRKNNVAYLAFFIYSTAFFPISVLLKIGFIAIVPFIFYYLLKNIKISYKIFLALFIIAALASTYFAIRFHIYNRALDYLIKKDVYILKEKSGKKIAIAATLKTVAESKGITLNQLFTYSSGSSIFFCLGSLGLLLLIFHFRTMFFLLLPYLLALLSIKTGVRFTTFGVPVIIMGNLYIFWYFYKKLENRFFSKYVYYVPATFLLIYYLNILNQYNHMLSPFFIKGELKAIAQHLNKNDKGYILTWWDYGWPLWYYTNKRTLIDNGKYQYDTYIVAKTLFSYDQNFIQRFDQYFIKQYDKVYPGVILPKVIKKIPLNELITKLYNNELNLSEKQKKYNIYYYFDDKILTKLPVIESFSYLKGEKKRGFIWITKLRAYSPSKGIIIGDNVRINLKNGILYTPKGKDEIGNFYVIDGKHILNILNYRKNDLAIIIYKNKYIIGCYKYINSFFFRAFFFNDLDKTLFKTVHFDKDAKIFQLIGK
ncbi:STT3 domain-containing protein [Nitratiruptor tergarcus]|uniref:Uncharacterized membrane protein, required for N-linked glycosylation n=1 Tax=Nitratiruptor tergarcus DSM 16512 TaxID=1069081 RepID=A0A1W1WV40_9BACT|nr:STT3 domain-containing protein [Nitratiruptor tergarcus]SMC09593.1 Uncharacterized membrane protein, required for N-linked glycosylation [Nitratiruptor tergarcus DSM 16512]